jgi:hypothetical protein
MVKKTNIQQLGGVLEQLSGTYNGLQFCKNGVIRLISNKSKKKIKDV